MLNYLEYVVRMSRYYLELINTERYFEGEELKYNDFLNYYKMLMYNLLL